MRPAQGRTWMKPMQEVDLCACTPSVSCCRMSTWPNIREAAHPKNKLSAVYQAHPSADCCCSCLSVLSPLHKKSPTTQWYLVGRPWPAAEAGAGGCCGRVDQSGQQRWEPAAVPRCPLCWSRSEFSGRSLGKNGREEALLRAPLPQSCHCHKPSRHMEHTMFRWPSCGVLLPETQGHLQNWPWISGAPGLETWLTAAWWNYALCCLLF